MVSKAAFNNHKQCVDIDVNDTESAENVCWLCRESLLSVCDSWVPVLFAYSDSELLNVQSACRVTHFFLNDELKMQVSTKKSDRIKPNGMSVPYKVSLLSRSGLV